MTTRQPKDNFSRATQKRTGLVSLFRQREDQTQGRDGQTRELLRNLPCKRLSLCHSFSPVVCGLEFRTTQQKGRLLRSL
jgi:hypothetical protein